MITMMNRRLFLTAALMSASAAFGAVDPALLSAIPADASVVSGVHVEQAKASAFGRFMLSQMKTDDSGFQTFITETGFDPRRDLNEVVVATIGTGEKPGMLVLGRGIFNPGRITNAAKAKGATVTTYKGVDLLTHDGGSMAFIDASIALAGDNATVRAAIDQRTSAKKLPDAIIKKMQDLSAANDAWFYSAASPAAFFAGKISNDNLGSALSDGLMQSVTQASGGIKFTSADARLNGEAITRSDKDATALADVFRFLAQILQNGNNKPTGTAADAAALLSKMQITTQGNAMKISLNIPEDLLERLFGRRAQLHVAAK